MRPREERSPYWSGVIALAMSAGKEVIVSARAGREDGSGREVAKSGGLSDHMGSEAEAGERVASAEDIESWIRGEVIGLLVDDIEDALEGGAEDEPHKLLEWVMWRMDLGCCMKVNENTCVT